MFERNWLINYVTVQIDHARFKFYHYPLVPRRLSWVSTIMPYIFVSSSPNFSRVSDCSRVAEEAYRNTTTYICHNIQWSTAALDFLKYQLDPLTVSIENSQLWSTPLPPFEVLDKLQALLFSVVVAERPLGRPCSKVSGIRSSFATPWTWKESQSLTTLHPT